MTTERKTIGFASPARAVTLGLALAAVLPACKRPHVDYIAEEAKKKPAPQAVIEQQPSFLDPLLGAPWLGHSDDGALVTVEFFSTPGSAKTVCRTTILETGAGAPTTSSEFSASETLESIVWEDGKNQGKYDAATQSIEAKVRADSGTHEVVLKQLSATDHPELATVRKFVPDDERTRAEHEKFVEKLGRGTRWWKSAVGWDKLVTPKEAVVADGEPIILIRPDGNKLPQLPKVEPGEAINFPIICLLPPGSTLAAENTTVGVIAELHHSENVNATWILHDIKPGAVLQDLTAHCLTAKDEPAPVGEASLYVYLARTRMDGHSKTVDMSKPISNLLRIDFEIGGGAEEPAAEPESN